MSSLIPFYIIGFFMILMALKINKSLVRIEPKKVLEFLKMMALVTLIRVVVARVTGDSHSYFPDFSGLLCVWWEDAVFTLPILMMNHYKIKFRYQLPVIAISSLAFASGHLGYSVGWASILLTYVYFISYKYGLKVGLGTVMLCHVFYDVITTATTFLT
jgi:hypothetical protein